MRSPIALVALALPLFACAPKPPEPDHPVSDERALWAPDYAGDLAAAAADVDERERELDRIDHAVPSFSDKLKTKDEALVSSIFARADEDGRSPAYAERMKQIRAAKGFLGGREVVLRVAGACQAAAKSGGCAIEPSGAVAAALRDGVDKEGQKRLRGAGEAALLVERNRAALGPDAKVLETEADDVALASYTAAVALPEARARLQALIGEAERVRAQGEAFVRDEKAFEKEAGRSDADKRASAERQAAASKSLAAMDAATAKGKALVEALEKRVADAQKRHDDALSALRKATKKLGAK
jgi:hypothetical protein